MPPSSLDFRAEFPVTVLNAANNPALAATEILTVPTTVENRPNMPWDAKPAGSAGVPTLGFQGGRIEAGGATAPGEFAVVFGSEAAPFRFTGNALGKAAGNTPPAAAELKDGTLRWQAARTPTGRAPKPC